MLKKNRFTQIKNFYIYTFLLLYSISLNSSGQHKQNSSPDSSVCPLQLHYLFSPMFMLKDASEPFSNC